MIEAFQSSIPLVSRSQTQPTKLSLATRDYYFLSYKIQKLLGGAVLAALLHRDRLRIAIAEVEVEEESEVCHM